MKFCLQVCWCTSIQLDTPLARLVRADPGTEMIEHDLVRLQKSERLNCTSAADATISAWRVRHLIKRWEERQCWSVQSIEVWTRSSQRELARSNIHTSTAALRHKQSFD